MIIEAGKTYYKDNKNNSVYVKRFTQGFVVYMNISTREDRIDGWCAGKITSEEMFMKISEFNKTYTDFEGLRDIKLKQLGI